MDGSTNEHSDSDSGESWTLLEHSPTSADEVHDVAENLALNERNVAETNIERDEDTDGISIISDSDPESLAPCEISYSNFLSKESRPTEHNNSQYISVHPLPSNNNDHNKSIRSEDDLLGHNHGKLKTYVHRRNKRLSTVLNIIMLGSVITAAGVAIGHMWGAKNECTMHSTPSVNKILSNLYKLQEENAFLRNKLKELSLANNIHMLQRKTDSDKLPYKQQKCKKVFEEPLNNKNSNKITKCVDNDNNIHNKILDIHMMQPEYEKEFLNDMDKLKTTYLQNKSWLDEEIAKRMKREDFALKKTKFNLKPTNLVKINEEQMDNNFKEHLNHENELLTENIIKIEPQQHGPDTFADSFKINSSHVMKISYADSLKSDQQIKKIQKRESIEDKRIKESKPKILKTNKKNNDNLHENSASDDEMKKDDRYVGKKSKQEKKKHDRQKSHKKLKRKNKYDLWEIKGDMKDYDEFSTRSSQENILSKPEKNILSTDFELNNYINQLSDSQNVNNVKSFESLRGIDNKINHGSKGEKGKTKNKKNKENNWYEKRATLRTEARKKLEQELFGDTSPNNAGWYFRRMQKREQCRTKGDNSTYRKLSKRNMNFKTKH